MDLSRLFLFLIILPPETYNFKKRLMSEYQHYEFRSLARPLTNEQMRELRRYSSRAEINATSFSVDYNWGDLKGETLTLPDKPIDKDGCPFP